MKQLFCFFLLLSISFTSFAQIKYHGHTVKQGETIYSIAEEYGITVNNIYRYNPIAKKGVKTSSLLIFPIKDIINSTNSEQLFIKHKVKKKRDLIQHITKI